MWEGGRGGWKIDEKKGRERRKVKYGGVDRG
jgi:hypothetical protein